jgi:antirestriction protein ArdC
MEKKQDIYSRITDKIVADLERGVRPWLKPWSDGPAVVTRPLRHNGIAYNGINVVMLWCEAMDKGYTSPYWITYKQAQELGAQVRKGEKSSLVVYASKFIKTETNSQGEEVDRAIPFLKGYCVFNAQQVDGLPDHYYPKAAPMPEGIARNDVAEAFFASTGATIRHGGDRAFYMPSLDLVQMPHLQQFRDAESYYATLAHEVTHWTKHEKRLNREFGRKRWGDEGYAVEELVAELGASFLCADLHLSPEPREDHAAYIESWLKVLKNDKRAIFSAASHASRAAEYLHGLQKQGMSIAA